MFLILLRLVLVFHLFYQPELIYLLYKRFEQVLHNENLADFFTKAHPVNHHLKMMNIYTVTDQEGVLESGYIPYNDDNDQ